ncbi:hypothetical protein IGI37_000779 [Enterococcus sp. AZ194]|uniref:glycosyltransferase n=1 Tax=Enterococcus sp. AZ194 TaxID=2774629 RepID=UPI003F2159B2
MNKIKVLQINSGSKEFGGVSSILYNLFMKIDKEEVIFDFLTPEFTTYGLVKEDIEKFGGKLFEFGITKKRFSKLVSSMVLIRKFVLKSDYDVIHINSGSFLFNLFVSLGLKFAKMNAKVIIHSHNSLEKKLTLKLVLVKILNPLLIWTSDYQLACSKSAALSMFPKWYLKKVSIFFNAIDIERFSYSLPERERVRKKYGIKEDNFVVGSIGRMSYQKNQIFLLEVIEEVVKSNKKFVLFLIGKGPYYEKIKKFIDAKNLNQNVFLINETKDINSLYSAFDLFVLPSLYEGLPLVGVEAQATGLKLIASSEITDEVNIADSVEFINVRDKEAWIDNILSKNIDKSRKSKRDEIISAGYSIDDVTKKYECFYKRIVSE